MINFIINKELKNKKEIAYAIYYLCRDIDNKVTISYGYDSSSLNIYYGVNANDSTKGIYIPQFELSNSKYSPRFISYSEKFFMTNGEKCIEPYSKNDDVLMFNYDILYNSFYLISCCEEYENKSYDEHGRFLAKYSSRYDKIQKPFFDINSQILLEAINKFIMVKSKKEKFEIMLTHDVDSIDSRDKYVFLHNSKELLLNKEKKVSDKLKTLIGEIVFNKHLQIEKNVEIEKRYNAKSEFYFIQGVKHRLGKRYSLIKIKQQLIDLVKNGWVIGMHTNYFSYNDENMMSEEIKAIEGFSAEKVVSCRNHYLRFKVPETWNKLSSVGIKFDTTIGFSDKNGFRAGICQSFIPFDCNRNRLIDIYEIPLVIMDGIVMESSMNFEEKWLEIKKVIDEVKRYNGSVSILWHQRMTTYKDYREMYERILEYIVQNGGIFKLSKDYKIRYENEKKELEEIFSKLECDMEEIDVYES